MLRLQPNNAECYYNLGTDLSEMGRDTEAIPEFQYTLVLDPGCLAAYDNLAISLAHVKRLNEAVTAAEAGLKIDPVDSTLLTTLAALQKMQEQTEVKTPTKAPKKSAR